VNGELRQNGCTKDMIFSLPFLVSYISQYFTLEVIIFLHISLKDIAVIFRVIFPWQIYKLSVESFVLSGMNQM